MMTRGSHGQADAFILLLLRLLSPTPQALTRSCGDKHARVHADYMRADIRIRESITEAGEEEEEEAVFIRGVNTNEDPPNAREEEEEEEEVFTRDNRGGGGCLYL